MLLENIFINKEETPPLYRQIYLRFSNSISDGRLKPGDRVPSVRALASELNLARGTIETAYQLLINDGYLIGRGAAGTIVSPFIKPVPPISTTPLSSLAQNSLVHSGEAPLPFQMGLPALDAFPRKLWNRIASNELRHSFLDSSICPDARGHLSLRTAVAGYLGVSRGISCTPGQVFIVAGYRACLDLICRSLLQTGDSCWVEDPGYFASNNFFREAGAKLIPVPVDGDGMVVEAGIELMPDARFAVVTPTHQSPLCVALSMPRRRALLDWASDQESWIVEDDYDSEYRYNGRPLPALKSLDVQNRVLYCGTFSKVLLPGLRLAYLVVPEKLVPRFTEMTDKMHSHCPHLWQVTTARFIEGGHFGRHLKKMRDLYSKRRQLLSDALLAKLADRLSIDHQVGGMHLLARLGKGLDDCVISENAQRAGLSVQPLSRSYISATAERGLLLSFTNVIDREQAAELAERLAQAFVSQ
ncbi:PLP-dependent aminotransferase family protein [Undibacterium sp. TC4M20W]|uniref:MocR-like pyridoxine biosynthesis transcription factor PdxR n=1 Tax=Undibacterium sp. TC4M20W TaxID=3413052 RepID=UPI003BF24FE2